MGPKTQPVKQAAKRAAKGPAATKKASAVAAKTKAVPKMKVVAIKKRRMHTKVQFHRPITMRFPKKPKYHRRSTSQTHKMDAYWILKYPLTTESAMKKIEDNNTLVFIVDIRANKNQIKEAAKKMYEIKTASVNT
eukprot:532959_1